MGDKSKIEWCDASWNPATGCSRVSPGCHRCYAETLSLRRGWSKKPWTKRNAAENVILHPDRLDMPLRWRKPRMVFVNSMSDMFHELIPDDYVAATFGVMARAHQHTFQVLTKRPERMLEVVERLTLTNALAAAGIECPRVYKRPLGGEEVNEIVDRGWPLPNVWLGVSVEDQCRADERIPLLLETPAAVRWISAEPLLGPLVLERLGRHLLGVASQRVGMNDGLDWVVVGGETGARHRLMKIEWLESIVEQCQAANVPVFVKQDSGSRPGKQGWIPDDLWAYKEFPREYERAR